MIAPLIARIVLAVFVAPFLLIAAACAFAMAAAQVGECAGVIAAATTAGAMLVALHHWLGALEQQTRAREANQV